MTFEAAEKSLDPYIKKYSRKYIYSTKDPNIQLYIRNVEVRLKSGKNKYDIYAVIGENIQDTYYLLIEDIDCWFKIKT